MAKRPLSGSRTGANCTARLPDSVEAAIATRVALCSKWQVDAIGRTSGQKGFQRRLGLWERWERALVCSPGFQVGSPSSAGLACCLVSCLFQPLISGSHPPYSNPSRSPEAQEMGKPTVCVFFQWPFKHLTLGAAVYQGLRAQRRLRHLQALEYQAGKLRRLRAGDHTHLRAPQVCTEGKTELQQLPLTPSV